MTPHLATLVFCAGIGGLFWLNRDPGARISKALWIPTFWLLINGSRPVSLWFHSGTIITQGYQNADGSPVDATVYGILVLAGALILWYRWPAAGSLFRKNTPILLYFGYCALSILWSDYSFIATKRWIKACGDVVMVFIVLTEPDPQMAIKKWLSRAAFLLLPISVLFIKYFPDLGRSYNSWTWIPNYTGVTTFKNLLGMTCLVCGLGSLSSFFGALRDKGVPFRSRHLVAHGVLLATLVWLLHIANSMTSLSCMLLAGTLVIFTNQRSASSRVLVANLLVCGCIALSLVGLFLDPKTLLSGLHRDPTLTGRTAIWHVVLSMHTSPWVGTGFESFWMGSRLQEVWRLTEKGIQEAHNGYLEVYLNLGWLGIGFLASMIVTGYRNALASLRGNPQEGRIRLAFLTAALIYSLTEAGFRMMSPIWIMFLLAVTATPLRKKQAAAKPFRGGKVPALEMNSMASVPIPLGAGLPVSSRYESAAIPG